MDLHKYAAYTVADYLEDEHFRNWVLHPDTQDNRQWEKVFDLHPAQRSIADQARSILLDMKEYFHTPDLRNKPIDEKFIASLRQMVETRRASSEVRMRRRRFIRRLSVAASLLLLIGCMAWFWLGRTDWSMQVITTSYGERRSLELPDGSIVALNANSELRMAKRWKAGADRQVWLRGEAHFTVAPQPATKAKFTVVTNDLQLQVLGTVFNVHARERGTRVTLEEGKVTLNLRAPAPERGIPYDGIVMAPGEQIEFFAETGELQKSEQVNVTAQSAWKDGVLLFDGITLEQLGEIITETFGYPVEFSNDQIKDQTITGSIPAANDLDLLLETIEKVFELKIVKADDRLIFE